MFRALVLPVVCAVLASSPSFAADVPAAEAASSLDKPASLESGDVAAMQIALLFASGAMKDSFDVPVLASYDRAAKKVVIRILGGRDTVEVARGSLDDFSRIMEGGVRNLLRTYGIRLTDANTTTIYFFRKGDVVREMVRRDGGKFITP